MDVEFARTTADSLGAFVGALEESLQAVVVSRRISQDPLAYGLVPGQSSMMSMSSWAVAGSAEAEVRAAVESAQRLIGQLQSHIAEQEQVSTAGGVARGVAGESWSQPEPLVVGSSPEQVALWWAALTAAQRERVIRDHPEFVGNLDGVPFAVRDEANRRVLAQVQSWGVEARRLLDAGDVDGFLELLDAKGFSHTDGYDISRFWSVVDTSAAVSATLSNSRPNAPFSLIQFQLSEPPLAAIAVGDLDTATQVTVAVPGMGTTVDDSMAQWTMTARNLYQEQDRLADRVSAEEKVAVVAWIGYDTPLFATTPSLEVLESGNATVGARQLVSFLQGVTAARGWAPGENLSVVAHSYGTTTASVALLTTPVDNYVMLGSAGMTGSASDASLLRVPGGHVWASEAAGDGIADLGRGVASTHPLDPTAPSFGASTFSSEDAVVEGQYRQGSDGHSASPQVTAALAGSTTDKFGYLDAGTTPLYNSALASLGIAEGIVR